MSEDCEMEPGGNAAAAGQGAPDARYDRALAGITRSLQVQAAILPRVFSGSLQQVSPFSASDLQNIQKSMELYTFWRQHSGTMDYEFIKDPVR